RSAPRRRLHELPVGREPRLSLRQPVFGRAREPPVLPERTQLEPPGWALQEHHESEVRPGRRGRLGERRPGPPRRRLLPPVAGMDGTPAATIRNAVIHLLNEQPLLADLFELPGPADVALRCTNLRTMSGNRPVFVDR